MSIPRILLAALMVSTSAGLAEAAVVSALSGQASVITTGGLTPIDVGTQLEPGQRVLASNGSTVTIKFSSDCEITVLPGESYRVPEDPRCEDAVYAETSSTGSSALGLNPIVLGLGGAALAAGIVVLATQSDGDDGARPASP